MDFLNQNLKSNLEQMFMEQWKMGYDAGIASCIAGLEMLIETGKVNPEGTALLKGVIEGFKQGTHNA